MTCTYLLPIRRNRFCANDVFELEHYLQVLSQIVCEIVVVDGSEPVIFQQHAARWGKLCRHVAVDRSFGFCNDKANGICTGVQIASAAKIILADDDVRYEHGQIDEVVRLLSQFQVVRPQNFLFPLPWWARMESARMLINRATLRTADYPGTCAFWRDEFIRAGKYDGDVLFDNEELLRHFARVGASICYASDLFVRKHPPSFEKWIEQRPRQAYEDFPLRFKTLLFASILPMVVVLAFVGNIRLFLFFMAASAFASILIALAGWRRGKAVEYFPFWVVLFAPLWVMERAFSTYWAGAWRVWRGGYPFGGSLLQRGVGRDWFAGRPGKALRLSRNFNV